MNYTGDSGDNSNSGSVDADVLDGVGGSDTLSGGAGSDSLVGGAGADSLLGGPGQDTLSGGDDADILDGGIDGDFLDGGDGADLLRSFGAQGVDTLSGGLGADTLAALNVTGATGPFAGTIFDGGDGVDILRVGGPVFFGGTLVNMEGLDLVATNAGAAFFGATASQFSFGATPLVSGTGDVAISAQGQSVNLSGVVFDGAANVVFHIDGSTGADTGVGTSRGDEIDLDEGDDSLSGGGGNDELDGDLGNDTIATGTGADTVYMSAGQDIITDFDVSQDKFDVSGYGFESYATLQPYLSTSGSNVVFAVTYNGAVASHTFQNVTLGQLTASNFIVAGSTPADIEPTENADLLPGSSSADTLTGLGGADTLLGFGGDDNLSGGAGNDSLIGGAGSDTLVGGADADTLDGGPGGDSLAGGDGVDLLRSIGSQGVDTLSGGLGNDTLAALNVTGATGPFAGTIFDGGDGIDILRVGGPLFFGGTLLNMEGLELGTTNAGAAFFGVTASQFSFGATPLVNGAGDVAISAEGQSVNLAGVVFDGAANVVFHIDGSTGADTGIGTSRGDEIDLDEGDDSLSGGGGDDELDGDLGNDTIATGTGADTVYMSAGQDIITDFDVSQDKVDVSGYGFDTYASLQPYLSTSGSNVVFTVTYNGAVVSHTFQNVTLGQLTASNFVVAGSTPADIEPTENADLLPGSSSADTLTGLGGADTLLGAGGGDSLDGGAGNDKLNGGAGNDSLGGGDGADTAVYSGDREDYLVETAGASLRITDLRGGSPDGVDLVIAVESFEFADGVVAAASMLTSNPVLNGGDDNLTGTTGPDTIDGGDGADTITGIAGSDSILGGAGADLIYGAADHDTLSGGADNDTLDGGFGNDSMVGGDGADNLRTYGSQGVDTLSGGIGNDTLSALNMTNGNGTPFIGPFAGTTFDGGDGTDVLEIGGQVFFGGTLLNMEGLSLLPAGTFGGATFTSAFLGLTAGQFNFGAAPIVRGVGDVAISANGQSVNLAGVVFDSGANVVFHIDGSTGADTGIGTSRGDEIDLDEGDDSLSGGGGDDELDGDLGNDTISTGTGADTVHASAGQDIITDFDVSQDKFDLSGFGFDSYASVQPFLSTSGANVVFSVTYNGALVTHTFRNVTLGQLTASNFIVAGSTPADTDATENADLLAGSSAGDALSGLGGNDTLLGGGGDDTLNGGLGSDSLVGGTGSDSLLGGLDNDTLSGGDDADTLDGGIGGDSLAGGDGADLLRSIGAQGVDTLSGGLGNDTLAALNVTGATGPFGGTIFDGGDGIDILRVGGPLFFGGALLNMEGLDLVATNAGAAFFGATASQFSFGAAPLVSGTGDVAISANGQSVNLSGVVFDGGANVVFHIDGSTGADTGIGTSRGDEIDLDEGDDSLSGGGGNDELDGDLGNDTIATGTGADTVYMSAGQDIITDFDVSQDKFDLSDYGFDSFASLQPYLSTSGADVVLAVTYNGAAVSHTFKNVTLGQLTASNFVVAGSAQPDIDPTENADLLPGSSSADTLTGLAGADTLLGFGGGDSLSGGAGNDSLAGGAGADTLAGGEGADTFMVSAAGDVIVDFQAGAGGDALSIAGFLTDNAQGLAGGADPFASGHLRLVQSGADGVLEFDANGSTGGASFTSLITFKNTGILGLTAANLGGFAPTQVTGGSGDDTVTYTPTAFVAPGDPTPVFSGGGGSDTLSIVIPPVVQGQPAAGPASITPSPDGQSLLFDLNGDGVTDLQVSAVGDIVLNGERVVIGGDLSGTGLKPDTIVYTGTTGDNEFDASGVTSGESVRATGLGGNDTLLSAGGDDTLDGGDGADVLRSLGGPDSLVGGAGADTLESGDGGDTLSGGAGTDSIDGGLGADVLILSGARSDYVVETAGAGLRFNDLRGGQPDGADVVVGVETFRFTGGDVALANIFVGNPTQGGGGGGGGSTPPPVATNTTPTAGPDTLVGSAGADAFDGGAGNDSLNGGAGGDFLRGLGDNDTVSGGDGDDTVNGNMGEDSVSGGAGADYVYGGQGSDYVDGGDGDDLHVNGNMGADTVHGGVGADTVYGGQGNDFVYGDDGADRLSGDLGDDVLIGGAGADTFQFRIGSGHDWIADFSFAQGDRIQLAPGTAYTLASHDGQLLIQLSDGSVLGLAGVPPASFSADWVVFG